MAEIPEIFDSQRDQLIADSFGRGYWQAKDCNRRMILSAELLDFRRIQDRDITDILPDKVGVAVKNSNQRKTLAFKRHMGRNCAAKISGADQNCFILCIQSQNAPDFFLQLMHHIAITLLPKAAEAVQILSNLRGSQSHAVRKLPGRNTADPPSFEFRKESIIPRKPPDDGHRYFFFFLHAETIYLSLEPELSGTG